MNNDTALPPLYLFVSLAMMVLLHFFIPVYTVIPHPWNAVGLAPLTLGFVLNMTADATLKKHATTVKPFEESSTLVTTGVYKYSRNPMYLGMALILIGVAILMGSITPYIVIPGFIVIIQRVFIASEENMLDEQFGNHWSSYREKVRRWL